MAQNDIMIVDDNPANLELLEEILLQGGREVRSFPLGRLALASAAQNPPDLILLDINMPEMNGYEVCERFKSAQALSDIPVIFLSALNETPDKIRAFEAGAVDYISKPFQLAEVHARVETSLKIHDLQRALKLHNEHLEHVVAERTGELLEANRHLALLDRSKNEFLGLISHEFRTPLNGLLGVGDLVLDSMPSTLENRELRGMFERSRRRILSILDDALLLTQMDIGGQQFRSGRVSLREVLIRATKRTLEFAESRNVLLGSAPSDLGFVRGDEDLLVRAFQALLETAVRFSEKGETVQLSRHARTVSGVVIESRGRTIPDPDLPKFFDVFSIGRAIVPGGDLGLAAAVANRILALFDASIDVANRDPSGIQLTVTLREAPRSAIRETPPVLTLGQTRQ